MAEIFLQAVSEACGKLLVAAWKIEKTVDFFAQMVIEARDNDALEIFLDSFCCELTGGADHAVDEQYRLGDMDVEHAVGAQADQAEFGILEGHRVAGCPT